MNKFNIIDIECTCWRGDPPNGQRAEIIEVGIVSLDLEKDRFLTASSHLVRPSKSEVSKYCEDLTGITSEMLREEGLQFANVLQALQALCEIHKRPWGSWGKFDYEKLREEGLKRNVMDAVPKEHYNIKKLDQEEAELTETKSLQTAMNRRNISRTMGGKHRALSDALGAAQIFREVWNVNK